MLRHPLIRLACLRGLLILTAVLLPGMPAMALDTLSLSPGRDYLTPALAMDTLKDDSATLTFEDILQPGQQARFTPNTSEIPNHGVSTAALWFHGQFHNDSGHDGLWYLEVNDALLTDISIHTRIGESAWQQRVGGSGRPHTVREMSTRTNIFRLPVPAGQSVDVYVRIRADFALFVPLHLWSAEGLAQKSRFEFGAFGLYYGVMLAMILYNVFLYVMLRERTYLNYLGFLLSATANYLLFNGFASMTVFADWPRVACTLYLLSYTFFAYFLARFSIDFLGLSATSTPRRWRITWALVALCACSGVLALLQLPRIAVVVMSVGGVLIDLFFFACAILSVRAGNPSARYYLAAWVVFLVAVLIFASMANGVLPANLYAYNSMQFASALGALILAIALAARVRQLMREREAAHQQMIQSERMAGIGMLSAGVAHDINNPNNFARISAQNLQERLQEMQHFINDLLEPDDDEMRAQFHERFRKMEDQLALIDEGTQRIADIVHGMRSTTRTDEGDITLIDPVHGLENTLKLVMTNFRAHVQADTDLTARAKIPGRMSQLNQVYMNLMVNACHAIEDAIARDPARERGTLTLRSAIEDGELSITIADDGCGMSEATQAALFTPFFTTKDSERGTGLGMSICKTLIEAHGGRIEVESAVGVGTCIRLRFPLTPATP